VPVDRIDPNPRQPREVFEEDELAELAASIREVGLLQPLVVRRAGERYELVAGERRLRAAALAGLAHVPVVGRGADDPHRLPRVG
jgi:ParB family chromosome partitioning protein